MRPVAHDVITEALLGLKVFGKSDSVIDHTQHSFLPRLLQSDYDLPRLSMLIRVDDGLTRDSIEMRGGCVILEMN